MPSGVIYFYFMRWFPMVTTLCGFEMVELRQLFVVFFRVFISRQLCHLVAATGWANKVRKANIYAGQTEAACQFAGGRRADLERTNSTVRIFLCSCGKCRSYLGSCSTTHATVWRDGSHHEATSLIICWWQADPCCGANAERRYPAFRSDKTVLSQHFDHLPQHKTFALAALEPA